MGWRSLPTASMWRSNTIPSLPPLFPPSNLFTVTINRESSTALYVVPTLPLPSNSAEARISISSVYCCTSPQQNTSFPLLCASSILLTFTSLSSTSTTPSTSSPSATTAFPAAACLLLTTEPTDNPKPLTTTTATTKPTTTSPVF